MHRVVPELIVSNYRAGRFGGEFTAVGMFLDLSGFSRMTDTLMQHGQHGAEVLAGLMHGVFDPLVRSIFGHGGKIVSFAGDGIMALYPVEQDRTQTALRALASAWVIQQGLLREPERTTVYGTFPLSVKIGITVGSTEWRILRAEDGGQATYYFRGSAVDGSADAEHHALAGEILLTGSMHNLLRDWIETQPHGSFHRFAGFLGEAPKPSPYTLPPVDLEIARIFMPKEVIVHDIRGEFRQIVNLFMRIPDLPDERLKEFINVVFELRRQYGGLLTRIDFGDKGCNLLMLWGAPVAYENDIGRALNFVLDLQKRMDFPITAGVTYYIAHAGYLGSEMCEDYTCYGWGVNLASRFMVNAPAGQVWVDERVARRVSQHFEIDHVGSQTFKGFAAEQKVYVLWRRKHQLSAVYQGEMVGREEELDRLAGFVEPLWQGRFAGFLSLTGDAGIGKSRLIQAFYSSGLFDDHKVLWGFCMADQVLRRSFNPLRGWLLRYFGILQNQPLEERQRAFDSKLDDLLASLPDPELVRELDRTRSILGALVELYWDDSLYSQLDAEARYNNTFLALIALVKAESLRRPFILTVDDLHFVDPDTITFLSQLKRSLSASPETYPAAVILTYRRQGLDVTGGDDLADTTIKLTGITLADVSRLAETLLGGPASRELVTLVMARSEGNPYFAEQVIRYLQEENLLEMSAEGWRQVRRGRTSVLPGDIRALLVARLDQLAHEVKTVVQTASVLGREFEVRVLAQMLGPGTDTLAYVSEAEKAAIWSPLQELRYIFHHGLLRDAAYSMQMRARRRELHLLALGALEELFAAGLESRYAELAYHAEQGEELEKAQRYYALAGRVSASLYQNHEAVDYFSRALAYTPFDDLAAQFDLVAERIELHSRLAKRDQQLKDLDTLEQWALQLNDRDRLVKVKMLRSAYHYFMGNYQESIRSAMEAQDSSESLANSDLAVYTQVVWATDLLRLGRMDEAMRRAQSTLERVRALKNRNEECRILNIMGWIALEKKEAELTKQYLKEALEIAREMKNPDVESKALSNLAMAEGSLNGNYALAREYYEQSYRILQMIGDQSTLVSLLANLGFIAGMLGDFSAARSYHEQALRMATEVGNLYQQIYTLINISALDGIQDQADSARQNAQRAAELARKASDRSGEAWAMLYLGHACLLGGEFESAQEAYQACIGIREEMGQSTLAMEPLAGLVEVHLAKGDLEAASLPAEKILHFLAAGSTLDGVEEPLRILYACYLYLKKKKNLRSRQILQTAKEMLETQASKFVDEAERRRYIENIPWRRAVWQETMAPLEGASA
jgi:predicted ATPase/class 3 adenylate cyclase